MVINKKFILMISKFSSIYSVISVTLIFDIAYMLKNMGIFNNFKICKWRDTQYVK